MTVLTGYLRLIYRLPLMLLHLLIGTPVTVICQTSAGHRIRFRDRPLSEITSCWWSRMICFIFGLKVRVLGQFESAPLLVVANHISWIDIPLLHSPAAMGFVAKAEISGWPLVGSLARSGGVVFHQRGDHGSASGVTALMADRLREQRNVAIFPEGGILPGKGVKRFHARMFAAAIETGSPVQPVMLRYIRDGQRYEDITFLPGEHFVGNFFRLLMQQPCIAEVRVLPVIESSGKQRRQLAEEAEALVRAAYDSDVAGE